jgi:hypothetical protein
MPLPESIRQSVHRKLKTFCDQRIPIHLREKVRMGFRFRGNTVTLYEERLTYPIPDEWVNIVVAQFRYDNKTGEWTLYCADRNS